MLKYYLSNEDGVLEEKSDITSGCWINMIEPSEEEILKVSNTLQIPIEFIKDPLDEEERSRIEKDEENVLIIVNIPLSSKNEREPKFTIPFH
ncbi:CorA family divalent cation transporter [Bacillaceae bacterium CLA-AA-H227]|uniref:CorA family divalent cation transporter n=1 Tax=Robertmurraya yapensis (ex Hitch et al 2024) TaxID=3133160 RepID=A0ACC6SE61_9BACI